MKRKIFGNPLGQVFLILAIIAGLAGAGYFIFKVITLVGFENFGALFEGEKALRSTYAFLYIAVCVPFLLVALIANIVGLAARVRSVGVLSVTAGLYWSMSAPTVSESYSKGNRSNSMSAGKMTSQLEFHRYSKEIAGNLANVVCQYQFKDESGRVSNLWINEEMRQFNLTMRVMNEERLWVAEYNRNANGEIPLKDRDNGKPIPHTAGMLEICRESNYDTYGEYLTLSKIKRTIGDVLSRDTDDGAMTVVLMGGKGFLEDFDEAMKLDAKENGFLTPLGEKEIQGEGNLTYGAYFRKYKTVDGHTIVAKHCSYFDKGTIAEAQKQNGMIHPRTGYPLSSHQACFIDFSNYEGNQNVRMVRQKGQIYRSYRCSCILGSS